MSHIIEAIKYLPLGDSYTIGEGVGEELSFPVYLSKKLQKLHYSIDVVANPSRTGWTTKQLIEFELPIFREGKPNFSTLLIGVNDWVQKVEKEIYQQNLEYIIEEMLKILPSPKRLILVTIPDFSATPEGVKYSGGRDISEGIAEFNEVIKEVGKRKSLVVVDIYKETQKMKYHPELIASDGLHPSEKEYEIWAEMILPFAEKALSV